ncbi:MAG: DedA family protein [Ktedonobacteraceae bacterium]
MRWLPILRVQALCLLSEPLAALISLETLRQTLEVLGYPAVMLFIMIESSGVPFPGETMLLLAAFYAAIDQQLQLPIIIACAAFGAIFGDNIGYYVGRTGGRAFAERFGRYIFLKPEHLDRSERFFAKYGDKTVFLGRFISILRTWSAFLAGVNQMPWRTFLFYNAAGGIVWAIIFGTLGYLAGRVFSDDFSQVERLARTVSWIGGAAIVTVVVLTFFFVRWRLKHLTDNQPGDDSSQRVEESLADSDPQASPTEHAAELAATKVAPVYTDVPAPQAE